jgi:hypothetical protein
MDQATHNKIVSFIWGILPTQNMRPLKWTARKRDLATAEEIEALCAAAFKQMPDGSPVTKNAQESLRLARKEAGLPKFTFHDCRHHFISMCVRSGIDFMTIARWVGHKDGGGPLGTVTAPGSPPRAVWAPCGPPSSPRRARTPSAARNWGLLAQRAAQ